MGCASTLHPVESTCHDTNPFVTTTDRHSEFFALFGSFQGYINHFHPDGFVGGHGAVRFLPLFKYFEPVLPSDLPTYERYRLDSLDLIEAALLIEVLVDV